MVITAGLAASRFSELQHFLTAHGWGGADRQLLAGDASFRTYWRLIDGTGAQRVLMDAPPPQEDVRPFMAMAEHLLSHGLSAPRIFAADTAQGFLLLDDFGDATYTKLLTRGGDEAALYGLAVDALAHLQKQALPTGVAPYDRAVYQREAALLPDWFLPAVDVTLSPTARTGWDSAWQAVWPLLEAGPRVLVLRDYHVDNLMLLPHRRGLAACGLLDFQDALIGHPAYDLMSLLEDARRDIDPSLQAAMKNRYGAGGLSIDPVAWAVLAAQRHAKVIGIFARLAVRDGKPLYLEHLPRVWRLLEAALTHPALSPVKDWLDRHAPPEVRHRSVVGQSLDGRSVVGQSLDGRSLAV